jgi:hypothetical protein
VNDQSQLPKITGIIFAIFALALGYGLYQGNLENPRPFSLKTSSAMPDSDNNKVESRLWQDPFEPFESATNQAPYPDLAGVGKSAFTKRHMTALPGDNCSLAGISSLQTTDATCSIVILGVMLEGGSYAENKEVRLRTRYAVETALLTAEIGPDDRTHIHTNVVPLTSVDNDGHSRPSLYAYEWFRTKIYSDNRHVCVLWLNEDDFSDDPALRLGSLLKHIPSLTDPGAKTWFYLIGPRSSDTLKALAEMHDGQTPPTSTNLTALQVAAMTGHFSILSPEATASVDPSDTLDPQGQTVKDELSGLLRTNIFHNWIASDQLIATLISRELTNRIEKFMPYSNNVVVLLSEQDTYYGRKLADEWIAAMTNRVCTDEQHVWQYAYLRGLDGSKPQPQPQDRSPALATAPETALETVLAQQQGGERADGDAQLDYVVRLAGFLKQKDQDLQAQSGGRIVAFGLTGSDAYDKLLLLKELRHRFPEAAFFTSDLDASLWTAQGIKYARNLLVGSAYPVDPVISPANTEPLAGQFAPFRDVYQAAVFRACWSAISYNYHYDPGITNLDAAADDLRGGLYIIGRHGPVPLSTDASKPRLNGPGATGLGWPCGLMASGVFIWLLTFFGGSNGGIRRTVKVQSPAGSGLIGAAERKERSRQVSCHLLITAVVTVLAAGAFAFLFQYLACSIARQPGEEPWVFSEGVSIWPTEYLRGLVLIGAGVFVVVASHRRQRHRQKLWEDFFREDNAADQNWGDFYERCRQRWRKKWLPGQREAIIQADAHRLWEMSGRRAGKADADLRRANDDWLRAETELNQERDATLYLGWTPPLIEVTQKKVTEVCVNAAALFKCYLRLGRRRNRVGRASLGAGAYTFLFVVMMILSGGIPSFILIRGHLSHVFDQIMLALTIPAILFVLFYVFDAAFLTKRILDYFSRLPTCWPEPALKQNAIKSGLCPHHLDAVLDIEFAAVQTGEIGPLMLGPIMLMLILVLSRICYFDNWTWPPGLVAVFVANFLLAGFCWWMVRRAADNVRRAALERLEAIILLVKGSPDELYEIPSPVKQETPCVIKVAKKLYLENLGAARSKIEKEHRGAFAQWFQDPTYLAVFIPSSISGIISLIISYWINR